MMKRRKAVGVLAIAMCASLLMAGCDLGKKKGADASGSAEVELRFSWWGNDDRHQATQSAIDAFNAKYEGKIKVTGEPSGFGNLDESFATRYAGGTAPDIMTINYPWLIQYSADGKGFYDLSKVGDTLDLSQYESGFLKSGEMGGVQQAVPYGQNTLGFYVNKTALERAGITSIPATFDEYKKAAHTLSEQDPGAYLIVSPTFRFAGIYYLQQVTGKGEFGDDLSMNYTAEDYQKALEWFKEMADAHVFCSRKDYIENVGNDPTSVAQNAKFIEGRYAGVFEWSGGIPSNAKTLAERGDELVIAPLPTVGNAKFTGTLAKPSMMMTINKDTKYPKEAATFLQFILNDPEGTKLMGTARGLVGSRAAYESLKNTGQIQGVLEEAYRFTDDAEAIQNSPIFENATFTTSYEKNYERYELGQMTSEEAAEAIYQDTKAQSEKLKKEYGYAN